MVEGNSDEERNSLQIGFGKAWARIGGPMVILVFLIVATFGTHTWLSEKRFAQQEQDHMRIGEEMQLQTCVLSMTLEERRELRQLWAKTPFGTLRQAMVLYCPWLQQERRKNQESLFDLRRAEGKNRTHLMRMLNAVD